MFKSKYKDLKANENPKSDKRYSGEKVIKWFWASTLTPTWLKPRNFESELILGSFLKMYKLYNKMNFAFLREHHVLGC